MQLNTSRLEASSKAFKTIETPAFVGVLAVMPSLSGHHDLVLVGCKYYLASSEMAGQIEPIARDEFASDPFGKIALECLLGYEARFPRFEPHIGYYENTALLKHYRVLESRVLN